LKNNQIFYFIERNLGRVPGCGLRNENWDLGIGNIKQGEIEGKAGKMQKAIGSRRERAW
jgi:hypothetical protein